MSVDLKKPSGFQNRKAAKERREQAQLRHQEALRAGGVLHSKVDACSKPERAHLWQLQRLLDRQHELENAKDIPVDDKIRHTCNIAQAMGRIRAEADLERQVDELEAELNRKIDELRAAKDRVEMREKRGAA